jgi:hypothetical protein
VSLADLVRVRRLSDSEGLRMGISHRGAGTPIRLRRSTVVLASADGNTVPAIARLMQADEDTGPLIMDNLSAQG